MNPTNIDLDIKVGIHNAVRKLRKGDKLDKLNSKKLKISKKGSPNCQVIYNLDIHELTY